MILLNEGKWKDRFPRLKIQFQQQCGEMEVNLIEVIILEDNFKNSEVI